MSRKHRSYLSNMNRMIIFSLSVAGLLMDGFQPADVPCAVALVVWLWLPICTRIEEKAIDFGISNRIFRNKKTRRAINST